MQSPAVQLSLGDVVGQSPSDSALEASLGDLAAGVATPPRANAGEVCTLLPSLPPSGLYLGSKAVETLRIFPLKILANFCTINALQCLRPAFALLHFCVFLKLHAISNPHLSSTAIEQPSKHPCQHGGHGRIQAQCQCETLHVTAAGHTEGGEEGGCGTMVPYAGRVACMPPLIFKKL